MSRDQPTWDDDVAALFAAPYWIESDRRSAVATQWRNCMEGYFVYLDKYESVREWGVTIYNHLHSRNMPPTSNESEKFPGEALEVLRLWINQGSRRNSTEPFNVEERIPPWRPPAVQYRERRDIQSLSQDELNRYCAKLDDVMRVWDASPDSPWQKLAYIHTNWCLHYQEAFILWHRAYLCYFEELIDHPVPYWNWMAEDASNPNSPNAGLPQAFTELEYKHPDTGEVRPNPLRFAAAKDGRSKACAGEHDNTMDCRWVQRYPYLCIKDEALREARDQQIKLTRVFQAQVSNALQWSVFSSPQGNGRPWANIPTFSPPQPDDLYPHRTDFDGLYEQPHDNYHGWIGPDMADNAYTAFDPIFWSYHANIDRIYEVWRAAHPNAVYTAGCALPPFIGPRAASIEPADPRTWRYTTIGDMAQDARRCGFAYGRPTTRDYVDLEQSADFPPSEYQAWNNDHLWVVFLNVRCTLDSYLIDVFLQLPSPTSKDVDPENPHYVGRFSRIGMGIEDDKERCIKQGVTRVLDASKNATALGIRPNTEPQITLLVTDVKSGSPVGPDVYEQLPGFIARPYWGGPWPIGMELARTASASGCRSCKE